jgi:hypothetical protein
MAGYLSFPCCPSQVDVSLVLLGRLSRGTWTLVAGSGEGAVIRGRECGGVLCAALLLANHPRRQIPILELYLPIDKLTGTCHPEPFSYDETRPTTGFSDDPTRIGIPSDHREPRGFNSNPYNDDPRRHAVRVRRGGIGIPPPNPFRISQTDD